MVRNGTVIMNTIYMHYAEAFILTVVVAGCYLMVSPM